MLNRDLKILCKRTVLSLELSYENRGKIYKNGMKQIPEYKKSH